MIRELKYIIYPSEVIFWSRVVTKSKPYNLYDISGIQS